MEVGRGGEEGGVMERQRWETRGEEGTATS